MSELKQDMILTTDNMQKRLFGRIMNLLKFSKRRQHEGQVPELKDQLNPSSYHGNSGVKDNLTVLGMVVTGPETRRMSGPHQTSLHCVDGWPWCWLGRRHWSGTSRLTSICFENEEHERNVGKIQKK
jgi:hypothetical protein